MGTPDLNLHLQLLNMGGSEIAIREGNTGVVIASVSLNPAVFTWSEIDQQVIATALMEGLINNHFATSAIQRKIAELGRH